MTISYLSHPRAEMLDPFAHVHVGVYETTLAALNFWNTVTRVQTLSPDEIMSHSAGLDVAPQRAPFARPCAHDRGSLFAHAFNLEASKPVGLNDPKFADNGGSLPVAFRAFIRPSRLSKEELELPRTFFAGSVMRLGDALDILFTIEGYQSPNWRISATQTMIEHRLQNEEDAGCPVITPRTDRPVILLARDLKARADRAAGVTIVLPKPGDVAVNAMGLPYYIYNGPCLVDDCIATESGHSRYIRPDHTFIEFDEKARRDNLVVSQITGWPKAYLCGCVGSPDHIALRREAGLHVPDDTISRSLNLHLVM